MSMDLVHRGQQNLPLDGFCEDCINCRPHPEGEVCALYSEEGETVFCEHARTNEGPCGRVALGFDGKESNG